MERHKETAPRMLCLRPGHREEGEEAASSLGAGIWLLKWDSPLQTQGMCWRGAGKLRRLHEGPWVWQGRGLDAAPPLTCRSSDTLSHSRSWRLERSCSSSARSWSIWGEGGEGDSAP